MLRPMARPCCDGGCETLHRSTSSYFAGLSHCCGSELPLRCLWTASERHLRKSFQAWRWRDKWLSSWGLNYCRLLGVTNEANRQRRASGCGLRLICCYRIHCGIRMASCYCCCGCFLASSPNNCEQNPHLVGKRDQTHN